MYSSTISSHLSGDEQQEKHHIQEVLGEYEESSTGGNTAGNLDSGAAGDSRNRTTS